MKAAGRVVFFYWLLMGVPSGSVVKNLPANPGDSGLIPGSGRSPGEVNGNPLQFSCLGNSMDRGAWRDTVHGVAKSHTTELEHKEVKLAANPGLLVSRFVDCNLVLQVSPSYLCRKTSRLSLRFCPVQAEVSRDSGPQQSQSAPCSSETSVI